MARTTNGAPEFLQRAAAVDSGRTGYAMDLDEPREPVLTADDYGGVGRRNAKQRCEDAVNLSRLEEAIGNVAASNVKADRSWEDKPPLEDIAERMAKLTYGEMVELAEGLVSVQDYAATDEPPKLAAFLWKWCTVTAQPRTAERSSAR
jgi:hypothetical protein